MEKRAFFRELLGLNVRRATKELRSVRENRTRLAAQGLEQVTRGKELRAKAIKQSKWNPFNRRRKNSREAKRMIEEGDADVARAVDLRKEEKSMEEALKKEREATFSARKKAVGGIAAIGVTGAVGKHYIDKHRAAEMSEQSAPQPTPQMRPQMYSQHPTPIAYNNTQLGYRGRIQDIQRVPRMIPTAIPPHWEGRT